MNIKFSNINENLTGWIGTFISFYYKSFPTTVGLYIISHRKNDPISVAHFQDYFKNKLSILIIKTTILRFLSRLGEAEAAHPHLQYLYLLVSVCLFDSGGYVPGYHVTMH